MAFTRYAASLGRFEFKQLVEPKIDYKSFGKDDYIFVVQCPVKDSNFLYLGIDPVVALCEQVDAYQQILLSLASI